MSDVFAFLSPAAVSRDGEFEPLLRTPMERNHIAAGATIEEADGWRVASYDARPGRAWIADVSPMGKIDIRGTKERIDELTAGAKLGTASKHDGVWTLRLTETRAVVICANDRVAALKERIGYGTTDMTCAWAGVVIGGPDVREVFMRSSSLDVRPQSFPVGACMVGSVMRAGTIILNMGSDRIALFVGWEFGEYFWEAMQDAGVNFGIAPVSASVALEDVRQASEVSA
jgi:heterotetrameric sarcosine oxidase gamma subunit